MNKGSQENGVNAITGRGYNPSVALKRDSSPCTGEPRSVLRALGANLAQGSQEAAPITFVHACTYCFQAAFVYLSLSLLLPQSGNKIQLCPLAARRSRFGFAISRSRTAAACRLAASATGGARKPNPSGEGHPPLAVCSQSPWCKFYTYSPPCTPSIKM